jgi:hypothetical protein
MAETLTTGTRLNLEGHMPEGAGLDPSTGLLRWTTTESQGPAEYTFTVRVTDGGNPTLDAEKTITVTV